ncbi:MAG: GTPase [Candidatus Cloacimonadota bacterium]|nr:MAG: GTPase [Candidatus Cloacimonadota bacterium]
MNMDRKKVIIMGAAGRDFHNFNTFFRDNSEYEVIGFTATQIPNIEGRKYPKELAGELYPDGIPIFPENELTSLIKDKNVEFVVFSYSDVSHTYVMHKASEVLAAGAHYLLLGSKDTMLKSEKPIIAICAVRTGSGKSQTTRRVTDILAAHGKKVVVIRHPMPYGDLKEQIVQRFSKYEDLEKHKCTIEEREEYEPHIEKGIVVYAGVDYEKILREAENEADIILWDGGNNDIPFYKPDLHIVVLDPLRAGHELLYHPGETNLRMCDVAIINKIDSAKKADVEKVRKNIKDVNPDATIIEANSPVSVDKPDLIKDKKVLVIEDGPTLTHGGMSYGAGFVAAERAGVQAVVDPRPFAVRTIKETFNKYPQTGKILPAMGYGEEQIKDLEETINSSPVDAVIIATPIDLSKLIKINKPSVRVKYKLEEIGDITLSNVLNPFLR